MKKDWLTDAINEQAESEFYQTFRVPANDGSARRTFRALMNTEEFKNFKHAMINYIAKRKTDEILRNLEGVKELVKKDEE